MRKTMQPWIIEELWRREEDERQRREEWHRGQIQIDAPVGKVHDESREDEPKRGVLIIEL
jgi:hypothetical protein